MPYEKGTYICPDCSALLNGKGICPECWIKNRKKVELIEIREKIYLKITPFLNNNIPWSCPDCSSNSIALDPSKQHKCFHENYREFDQLIRCCNCGLQFLFKYKLQNIEVHSYKKEGVKNA